jgi:hypothetical protein
MSSPRAPLSSTTRRSMGSRSHRCARRAFGSALRASCSASGRSGFSLSRRLGRQAHGEEMGGAGQGLGADGAAAYQRVGGSTSWWRAARCGAIRAAARTRAMSWRWGEGTLSACHVPSRQPHPSPPLSPQGRGAGSRRRRREAVRNCSVPRQRKNEDTRALTCSFK